MASEAEPLIYREEVTAILGAIADMVVELRAIRQLLREDDGGEEEEE